LPIFNSCKHIFGGGYAAQLHRCIPSKEGEMHVLAVPAPSSEKDRTLLRTPREINFGKKESTANSLLWKKYINYF